MPTISQAPVEGFAHCRNPRCQGSQQQKVEALRSEESYTFTEKGGDLPGYENSIVRFAFANEEDKPCPHCGLMREVTESPRPSYDGEWGNQSFLLDIEENENGSRFDPSKTAELQAAASEKLQEENAELRERMARLEGVLLGQQMGAQEPGPAEED